MNSFFSLSFDFLFILKRERKKRPTNLLSMHTSLPSGKINSGEGKFPVWTLTFREKNISTHNTWHLTVNYYHYLHSTLEYFSLLFSLSLSLFSTFSSYIHIEESSIRGQEKAKREKEEKMPKWKPTREKVVHHHRCS